MRANEWFLYLTRWIDFASISLREESPMQKCAN